MSKYYVGGKKVTRKQFEEQCRINDEINQIDDNEEWLKAAARVKFTWITDDNGIIIYRQFIR